MKIKNLLFVAAAVLAVLACNKQENVPAGLSVDQTSVTIPATGGSVTVKVTSSEAWTAAVSESGKDWLHVTPMQGQKGVTPITITVAAITGQPRSARVNLLAGLYNTGFAVTQEGTEAARDGLTYETAWKPSEARTWILANLPSESGSSAKGSGSTKYWIKGKIHKIATAKDGDTEVEQYFSNNTYGNASFYICDIDGGEDATKNDFECFQVNYLGNRAFVKGTDTDIKVGDEVYIYGPVMNYNNKTPETLGKGSAFIFSLNGKDEGGAVTEESEAKGSGTEADPYNPAGVIAYIKSADWKADANVYVAGKISKITYAFDVEHGTGTFDITEDGSTNKTAFTCYSLLYLGNQSWIEGFSNVKVGDEVVICGNVKFYESGAVYETETKKAWLVSLNGNKKAEDVLYVADKEKSVAAAATEVEIDVLGTVAWTASVSEGATVTPASGTGAGKVKVSFPANEDPANGKEYTLTVSTTANVATKSFEVKIKQAKAPASGQTVVEFDFQGAYQNGTEMTTVEKNGVKLVFDKGSNKNAPKYYSTGTAVRLYGGNTMTVSGGTIAEIELTFSSGEGENAILVDSGTWTSPKWSGSASSVKFTVDGSSGHRRIAKVSVTTAL